MPCSKSDIKIVAPPFKSFEHIAIQGTQRRYIENLDAWNSLLTLKKHAENREKCSFSLARGGRRNKQNVLSIKDSWDSSLLWFRWLQELPLLNEFSNWFDKQLKSVLSFFQA
jgi:hypothetical protein